MKTAHTTVVTYRTLIAALILHYLVVVCVYLPFPKGINYIRMSPQVWLQPYLQWDSQWYLTIAKHGYRFYSLLHHIHHAPPIRAEIMTSAYFPFLPILIRLCLDISHHVLLPLIIDNVAFIASLPLLFVILQHLTLSLATQEPSTSHTTPSRSSQKHDKHARQIAIWGTFFFAVNPISIIYSSLYTESFSFLFALLVTYGVLRDHLWIAALAGCLSATTHSTGILVGAFVVVYIVRFITTRQRKHLWHGALFSFATLSGLLLFLIFLHIRFHDPLAFTKAEAYWHRTWEFPFVPYVQGILLATHDHSMALFFDLTYETIFLIAAIAITIRKDLWKSGVAFYTLASTLLIASTVVPHFPTMSVPRYLSNIWPLYLAFASIHTRILRGALLILCLLGGVYGAIIFGHGFWFE